MHTWLGVCSCVNTEVKWKNPKYQSKRVSSAFLKSVFDQLGRREIAFPLSLSFSFSLSLSLSLSLSSSVKLDNKRKKLKRIRIRKKEGKWKRSHYSELTTVCAWIRLGSCSFSFSLEHLYNDGSSAGSGPNLMVLWQKLSSRTRKIYIHS